MADRVIDALQKLIAQPFAPAFKPGKGMLQIDLSAFRESDPFQGWGFC
jgi:hypothetical protein